MVFPYGGCCTCNFCADRAVMERVLQPCTHEAARKAGARISGSVFQMLSTGSVTMDTEFAGKIQGLL